MEHRIWYARGGGLFGDDCWKGEQEGKLVRLYKRVTMGVALPQPEERLGVALVVAEAYQTKPLQTFTVLGARAAGWMELQGGLAELRRLFMPAVVVTEPGEEAVEALRAAPGLRVAADLLPVSILAAEKHALGEISKDRVNALLDERRLTLEATRATLDQVHEPAARALQCVVIWLLERPASYGRGLRSIKPPSYSWSRPEGEIPRRPFRRDDE